MYPPYPNVNADYTVVPGVTPVTNSLVTLTDGSIIDVDDLGQVRGYLRGPQVSLGGEISKGNALLGMAASAALSAAFIGAMFWSYQKYKTPWAPAIVVGASTIAFGTLAIAFADKITARTS